MPEMWPGFHSELAFIVHTFLLRKKCYVMCFAIEFKRWVKDNKCSYKKGLFKKLKVKKKKNRIRSLDQREKIHERSTNLPES